MKKNLPILICSWLFGSVAHADDQSEYIHKIIPLLRNYWSAADAKHGKVLGEWSINKNGSISEPKIFNSKFGDTYNTAVKTAIKLAAPYPPPPDTLQTPVYAKVYFDPPRPLRLSVEQASKIYGAAARKRLKQKLQRKDFAPLKMEWVFLKDKRRLNVFATGKQNSDWAKILQYEVKSASGKFGPKLREGDMQVPEGIYAISSIEASTRLSLGVNYPNAFDLAKARLDHRTRPGYGIQIHGGCLSTGCVVLSNSDMEELWILAHDCGLKNIRLILAPCNLAKENAPNGNSLEPTWLPDLYKQIKNAQESLGM